MKNNLRKGIAYSLCMSAIAFMMALILAVPTNALAKTTLVAEDADRVVSEGGISYTVGKTPTELVQSLLGEGVQVKSARFINDGCSNQVGIVTNANSLFGISQGVILSTDGLSSSSSSGGTTDDDLAATLKAETMGLGEDGDCYYIGGDVAGLEFEMTATGTFLNFNYVFASKEFSEGAEFNDIFGLYISVNDSPYENIALLPEGDDSYEGKAVTITNLRQGNGNLDEDTLTSGKMYTYFYGADGTSFNGVSKVFNANKAVNVGDKVKIKFVIADVSDTAVTSSVIIEAGSLSFEPPKAAKADVTSTTIVVKETNTEYTYVLLDEEGTAVPNFAWEVKHADGQVSKGNGPLQVTSNTDEIIFTGLKQDTKYRVQTYKTAQPADGTTETEKRTAINPMVPTNPEDGKPVTESPSNNPVTPVITRGKTNILVKNLNTNYKYVLKKAKGNGQIGATVVGETAPSGSDNSIDFTGLTPNTTYFLVAVTGGENDENPCSDAVETSTLKHDHHWVYTENSNTLEAKCDTTTEYVCEVAATEPLTIKVEGANNANMVKVTVDPEWTANIGDPQIAITYKQLGVDNAEYTSTVPTAAGTYRVNVKINNTYTICTYIGIGENSEVVDPDADLVSKDQGNTGKETADVGPDSGIVYLDGYLHFSSTNDHIKMYGQEYDLETNTFGSTNYDVYLDLTSETLVADFAYDCYSLNGGSSWKKASNLTSAQISKWFNAERTIVIADKYDAKEKAPGEDATVYYLGVTQKRPSVSSLKPDYYECRDPYGLTTGQWTMKTSKGDNTVATAQYEFLPLDAVGAKICKNDDTGLAMESLSDVNAFKDTGTWATWPERGGVWVPAIGTGDKVQKAKIQFRIAPTYSDGKYTPASKPKKITISSSIKPATVKVDYKKETIKFNKGMCLYFGEEILTDSNKQPIAYALPEELKTYEDYAGSILVDSNADQAKGFDISGYITETRNTILYWTLATAKKPASSVKAYKLAARGTITEEKEVSVTKGKVTLASTYEYYDTSKSKWVKASGITATTNTAFSVRIKTTAKGGSETDSKYAAGVPGTLMVYSDGTKVLKAVLTPKVGDAVIFEELKEDE